MMRWLTRWLSWLVPHTDAMIDGDVPTPDGRATRRGHRYRPGMEAYDPTLQARALRLRDMEEAKLKDARRRVDDLRTSTSDALVLVDRFDAIASQRRA